MHMKFLGNKMLLNDSEFDGKQLEPGTEVGCWIGSTFCKCVIIDYVAYVDSYNVKHGFVFAPNIPRTDIWIVNRNSKND